MLRYNHPDHDSEGDETMPLSEKKKAANAKWDAMNLKRLSLAVPVELYDRMIEHIDGESVNGFIKRAIDETINRDKREPNTAELTLDDLTQIKAILESIAVGNSRTDIMIKQMRDKVAKIWNNRVEQENNEST